MKTVDLSKVPTKTKRITAAISKVKDALVDKTVKKGVDLVGIVKKVAQRRLANDKEEETEEEKET